MSKATTTVKQLKELPGIASCLLEHEVTKTKATIKVECPKFSQEMWNQVLAFFRWTNNEHHSESQVRLYVNSTAKMWGAYAHPQEAKTGMSARTFIITETPEQTVARCTLMGDPDPANWVFWCTVHSHCHSSAFQSSVDEADEKINDGLHITMGKVSDVRSLDIHCRLYVSGHKFEPNMSWFWDVEPQLAEIPRGMRGFLQEGLENKLARAAMCVPAPKETEIPPAWKENVIEVKPIVVPVRTEYKGGAGYYSGTGNWKPTYFRSGKMPNDTERDLFCSRKEILDWFDDPANKRTDDPTELLVDIWNNYPFIIELIANCYRNDVSVDGLIDYMNEQDQLEAEEALSAENKELTKGKKGEQDDGMPDYNGSEWEGYGAGQLPQ